MALAATSPHQTYIPLPSANSGSIGNSLFTSHKVEVTSAYNPTCGISLGGRRIDHEVVLKPVPIHIVSHESQLPASFRHPSPKDQFVVGLDCEGVNLCRYGTLCIVQLAFPDAIYLVDAVRGGKELINACKPALESVYITKVIHDCKRDSEALYYQFDIKLHNVVDTQIAYYLIEEQLGKKPDHSISFVSLLADPRYCGISYVEKKEVRTLLKEDPQFWTYRPLSKLMVRAAADDVRFLPYIYHKMMEKLNELSLWRLAVRGSLCCRCFCISDNDYAEWPAIPSIPVWLNAERDTFEEEIMSVLDVPHGKMGCVIGRKGSSILSVKESCKAEILIGGSKGPPDKTLHCGIILGDYTGYVVVLCRDNSSYTQSNNPQREVFIIGPLKQVRKAEAILRGRML